MPALSITKRFLFVAALLFCELGTVVAQTSVGVKSLDQLVLALNKKSLATLQPYLTPETRIGIAPAEFTSQALTQLLPEFPFVDKITILKKIQEGNNTRYACDLMYQGKSHPCDFLVAPSGTFIELNLVKVEIRDAPSSSPKSMVETRKNSDTPSSSAKLSAPTKVGLGQPALAFTSHTMDGKTVHFPQDYKGKLVLLDFWATWCAPCRTEMPGIVAAYAKYHSKGFDVLSVSLDEAGKTTDINHFLAEDKITWPQVYEGHSILGDIPQKYSISAIPQLYLVDGTTGKIIASEKGYGGTNIEEMVGQALSKRTLTVTPKVSAKPGR